MSDFKSKLPDLKEVAEITGKLFKDIRTSFSEIISTYKQKHPDVPETEKKKEAAPVVKATSKEKEKTEEKPKATEKKKAAKAEKKDDEE